MRVAQARTAVFPQLPAAAPAATGAGQADVARTYCQQLLELAADASALPELPRRKPGAGPRRRPVRVPGVKCLPQNADSPSRAPHMQHQHQFGQAKIIRASLVGESGKTSGEVVDLNPKEGMVRIPIAQDPSFFIGESVSFEVDSKAGSGRTTAIVRSRAELDGFRRFGLACEASTLGSQLSSDLIRHFEQLRQHRVQPQTAVRVEVKARGRDIRTTGQMRNVSASGIAVVIDAEAERAFARIVDVDLEFRLPGNNQALVLCSAIRHRCQQEHGDGVCMGLTFDADKSSAFDVQQRAIADYILTRQAELVRAQMWEPPGLSPISSKPSRQS